LADYYNGFKVVSTDQTVSTFGQPLGALNLDGISWDLADLFSSKYVIVTQSSTNTYASLIDINDNSSPKLLSELNLSDE
jgi:hypothetical protein